MSEVLAFVAMWLAFGLLSLLLAYRSQLDAWTAKNPRAAGVMKLIRGLGIDPWLIAQSLTLLVKGRLPVPLQASQIVAAQEVKLTPEVKAEVKKQSEPPPPKDPPFFPPAATFLLGIAILFAPAVTACASSQNPQAQAAEARNYGRVAYSAAALGVKVLDEVSIAAMRAAQTPEQAQALEPVATKVNAGLHAARGALEAVRPWLEGGAGGSAEKEKLLEALDSVALVAVLLKGAGVTVPREVVQGVEAARTLLGAGS